MGHGIRLIKVRCDLYDLQEDYLTAKPPVFSGFSKKNRRCGCNPTHLAAVEVLK